MKYTVFNKRMTFLLIWSTKIWYKNVMLLSYWFLKWNEIPNSLPYANMISKETLAVGACYFLCAYSVLTALLEYLT